MEKKSTLEINLKKYAALAGGLTAVAGGLNAQVIYTDVDPDLTISGTGTTSAGIDFNNDAVADIGFVAGSWTGSTGTFSGYNYVSSGAVVQAAFGTAASATNGWMGSSAGPTPLSAGARIGATSASFFSAQKNIAGTQFVSWPNSTSYNNNYDLGNFAASQEAYIGVRFAISGDVHYGWIRVEIGADQKSMIIKDMAYESTPGVAILAGSQASMASVDELSNQVSIVNTFNNLNVNLNGINEANLSVLGLDGKQYANQQIGSSAKIDLSDFSTGIYLVNVTTEGGTTTKKIYVK